MRALSYPHPVSTLVRSLIAAAALFVMALAPGPHQVLSPTAGLAQDPPEVLPASLHIRLGIAADGYRTGGSVFVVAHRDPPHHVADVGMSLEDARLILADLSDPEGYGIFEVVTEMDFGKPQLVALVGHMPFTWCEPPGPIPGGPCLALNNPDWAVPTTAVDSVVLTVYHGGDPLRWTFGGNEVDAIFLTYSAFERFYVPYLAQVYGAQVAEQIRAEYERHIDSVTVR